MLARPAHHPLLPLTVAADCHTPKTIFRMLSVSPSIEIFINDEIDEKLVASELNDVIVDKEEIKDDTNVEKIKQNSKVFSIAAKRKRGRNSPHR